MVRAFVSGIARIIGAAWRSFLEMGCGLFTGHNYEPIRMTTEVDGCLLIYKAMGCTRCGRAFMYPWGGK